MNRHGKHNLYHMFSMCVLQMPALLFMAANVSVELDKKWVRFSLALLLLSFIQLLQYVYAYVMHKDNDDNKKLITDFIKLLIGRIVAILLSLLFTGNVSIILTGIGISLFGLSYYLRERAKPITIICTPVIVFEAALFSCSNILGLSKEAEIKNKI